MSSAFPSRSLPPEVERHLVHTLLSEQAQRQYTSGDIAAAQLASAVRILSELSSNYNEHEVGETLARPITSLEAAKAYALYYLPVNATKILHLLQDQVTLPAHMRVLDFGSGPGTLGITLLASQSCTLDLHCVESSRWMREAAELLLRDFNGPGTLTSFRQSATLATVPPGTFDLVVASNALAELSSSDRASVRRTLAERVAPGGYLLIIEPGQKAHTRRLMSERDALLSEFKDLAPLYPCLRRDSCPMLSANDDDWCHAALTFNRGPLARQLDDLLGFNKHRIKFSAFIFQKAAATSTGYRILTPPEKGQRGIQALVCGADFYGTVRLSKTNRTDKNRCFEKAVLHARIETSRPITGEITRDMELRTNYHVRNSSNE